MIALRIDDFGACGKKYERHRGRLLPYREMVAGECEELADWLTAQGGQATLAITAAWVEGDGTLTPFPRKYPDLARVIRDALGTFEVACHGLTHCVPGRHRPTEWPWHGNRRWHREFIPSIPFEIQVEHLLHARAILEDFFGAAVTTLVPPGNTMSERTALTALGMGYEVVTHRVPSHWPAPTAVEDDREYIVLHDRDFIGWRRHGTYRRLRGETYQTVRAWYRTHSWPVVYEAERMGEALRSGRGRRGLHRSHPSEDTPVGAGAATSSS